MTTLVLAGLGTANPPHAITSADAASIAQAFACETPAQQRLFQTMYRRAGVESRHSVVLERSEGPLEGRQSFFGASNPTTSDRMALYEAEAGALAVTAARRALDDAGIAPRRITHLVTVSCTGFHAPGCDAALIHGLDLDRGVARTHVGFMGCHGLLNGLRVARGFVGAEPSAVVLVAAVELCSLHHQYGWDSDKIVANALFADGAGAVVGVGASAGAGAGVSGSDKGAAGPFRLVASGSALVDASEDAMSWRVGDHGFTMTLSPRVPELIARHLRPWISGWLARHGTDLASVASWAVHPGGPRILSAVAEALDLGPESLETSQRVLAEFGNMSSPTVLFILERLRHSGAARPCVALAFGPGLAIEAALLH